MVPRVEEKNGGRLFFFFFFNLFFFVSFSKNKAFSLFRFSFFFFFSFPLFFLQCKNMSNRNKKTLHKYFSERKKENNPNKSARQLSDKEDSIRARRRDDGLRRVEADVVDRAGVSRESVFERGGLGVPDVGDPWVGFFFVGRKK